MNNELYDFIKTIDIKNELNNRINENNRSILSIVDVIRLLKKNDNSNEKSIIWYLKNEDNLSDIQNAFKESNLIASSANNSKSSEIYYSLYTMYDNICECINSLIVSDRVIKSMTYSEYTNYTELLNKGLESLNNILELPRLQKNPNKYQTMKAKKKELEDSIYCYKKIKKHNNKELLKKGLLFATGFVAGVGMSCVPGVGAIRMGLAGTKIVTSIINAWADRHPNGKISKVMNHIDEKFPKISKAINTIKNKMRNNSINVLVNGISVGYIVGNVFELLTGQTVIESITEKLSNTDAPLDIEFVNDTPISETTATPELTTSEVTTPTITDPSFETSNIADTISESVTPNIPVTDDVIVETISNTTLPEIPTIEFGQNIDVSGLDFGYGTSIDPLVGNEPVRLFTDLGHNVHIGSEKILSDGTKMWALFQEDGTGYAWFKADDVLNCVLDNKEKALSLVLK